MAKNNVIDFSKFDDIKKRKPKSEDNEKVLSPKEEAKQRKIEEELIRINKRYKKLTASLKDVDNDLQANIKVLKYCFTMSHRLLPIAEEIFIRYKNERAVYAIAGLVSQIREIANDLRMLSSNDKTVEYLLESVFLPTLQLVMQHMVNDFSEIKGLVSDALPPKKAKEIKLKLSKQTKAHGQLLDDIKKSVTEKVSEHFK
jgi:hypothetical protein